MSQTAAPRHYCGDGCERCRDHDPRDRRDHGHLTSAMCPACDLSTSRQPA